MPTTIQITTDNYDGQTAVITFTPDNGGPVVNIGSQVLPYDYTSDYYYGTYSLYFPSFDVTCTLIIQNQSPTQTPTPTNTPTPTITPTLTPTPTQTQSRQYYVYKLCNSNPPQYVVQTQQGLTGTPGKVIRKIPLDDDDSCWEFLYQTTNQNPFPPGTSVINWTGNYLSPVLETIFDNCTNCFNPPTALGRCWTMTWETDNPQTPPPPSTLYVRYTNSSGVVVSQSILSLPSIDNVGDNSATAFVCSYYPVAPLCVDYSISPPLIVACNPYIWLTQFNTCTTNLDCNSVTPPTATVFLSRISGTPNSFDGCAATLNTDCWVSNIAGAPGAEMTTSSSVVYANSSGTILFPGLGGTNQYKIKITGSSICTSNGVASDGSVSPLGAICASC
jgi:hypothetical protein